MASGAAKPRLWMTSPPSSHAGAKPGFTIHQAQVFRQRGYGRSVLIVEPHVQGVETGLWLSLRETILIEQSLQHELGRAGAIAIAAPSIASAETVEGPFS